MARFQHAVASERAGGGRLEWRLERHLRHLTLEAGRAHAPLSLMHLRGRPLPHKAASIDGRSARTHVRFVSSGVVHTHTTRGNMRVLKTSGSRHLPRGGRFGP
eukprot:3409927-Pyramimonas_sp.AAC.1